MMRKPHHCRYASCPGMDSCYCEMELQAANEVRQSMQMLAFSIVYLAAVVVLLVLIYAR